ncbi:MAG: phosphoenolpyruvate synthase [Chitinophagaceae bacterium]|nr:phosphoenolpyruvate synthase [Chitinophagaceae bacterium]
MFVLHFKDIDRTKLNIAGGKGANLGELTKIDGLEVPDGFCISTEAFEQVIEATPQVQGFLEELSQLKWENRKRIAELSASFRRVIEESEIPGNIREEILLHLDEKTAYAVRSSATAEDLPTASFAGQQDTFLNIIGKQSVLEHISKCWASLFTERAIIYRMQNGFDHRRVSLAVIIQEMVFPQVAGIMFTADPITSNRKVLSIDASFGLGEALVSGRVNPDVYKVRDGIIIDKKISSKKFAINPSQSGGTKEHNIEPDKQNQQALADNKIVELEQTGRRIEQHFGKPQDIEWCLVGDVFYVVQSRPVTTLFPIAEIADDDYHVFVSVGHQQMMTDAIKPLGASFWQLTARRPMYSAGGRLFVDIAGELASPEKRNILINVLGNADPLLKDALSTIVERGDFKTSTEKTHPLPDFKAQIEYDPSIVPRLVKNSKESIEVLEKNIRQKSGPALPDFILEDFNQITTTVSHPESFAVIMTFMNASSWINEKMMEWLGEKNAVDMISKSVPGNVTSEMGRDLLDVADVVRRYSQVVEYLENVEDEDFLEELPNLHGGKETRDAILSFLEKYGMRCAGEIDITKTRWSEKPSILIPTILRNVKNFEPGASKQKFEQGLREALSKEAELLERLRHLPNGDQKAMETKKMIDLVRNFAGYREYAKYHIVTRYFIYKKALLKEAEQLVNAGTIREKEDIFYLTFEELRDLIRTKKPDYTIIEKRKGDYIIFEKLTPPRLITSDGEIITGRYKRENLPANAIAGLPVSSGIVEGSARVILNMEDADTAGGDILVTPFTDPSWTPLFVSIKGLVTEVGGLMTHGAVIAREYGLPAVVGVENATTLIKDGQRIRINGTDGYIEFID